MPDGFLMWSSLVFSGWKASGMNVWNPPVFVPASRASLSRVVDGGGTNFRYMAVQHRGIGPQAEPDGPCGVNFDPIFANQLCARRSDRGTSG